MNSIFTQEKPISGYRLIVGYIGVLLMIIGIIVLLPLITLLFYPEDIPEAKYFILPGVGSITLGYLLFFLIRGKQTGKLARNQDAIIVVSCWILAIFITALPFVLSGKYNLSQAMFETTSAWSTTGLTVVDVVNTSHLFLMHRSLVLFFGGVGLVLIMLSVLSDSYGMRLYNAEGHSDRLLPNVLKSARLILIIYLGYIAAGVILYVLFGMPLFDAIIHSIGALSTGGFSNRAESIAYYDSLPIEIISIVLMILGNINFFAHLYLLRGRFKNFFRYCEIRFQILVIGVATILITILLVNLSGYVASDGLRVAIFQVVSALTTTGFQTVEAFKPLPSAILMIMIVLQLIGGGTGSTAGGIKQYRICVLAKSLIWHIQSKLHSHKIVYTRKIAKVDRLEKVTDGEISACGLYVFFYICLFFLGSFLLSCFGYSLQDCMFEFSSALSTVGLSAGIMTYDSPSIVLWIGTIGMFFGRLEIYIIIMAFARVKSDMVTRLRSEKQVKSLL